MAAAAVRKAQPPPSVRRTRTKKATTEKKDDDGQLLNKYLRSMGAIPLLSGEDEVEVARIISEGGADSELAKAALIKANLRLVVSIAKRATSA